ncbi:MAG TPA: HTTM domain-containing protein, partial [Kofleriaceae bacterium]
FNIGMFPIIMTSSALIFFPPAWPRRVLARIGPLARFATTPPGTEDVPVRPRRAVVVVIAAYVALQIALPLRHVVYPGPVLWNEDGMRFAWHVLVREKHGSVTFVAAWPDGKRLEVPVHSYLTPRQEREMGGQPDLILQLGKAIGRDLEQRGYRGFQIHAITRVSLNGRPAVPMIDEAVDLRAIDDLGPRTWVLPAPTMPPPQLQPLR